MEMERLSKSKISLKKRHIWQPAMALFVFVITIPVYVFLPYQLALAWVFGISAGFIMQRSRICFTAAWREPFLFGMTDLSKAIILSLMISSIGFAVIQYSAYLSGAEIPGKFVTLGLHIPIGAFVFGLGASFSGSCASGTLVRLGEGMQLQWFVLAGFIIGSVHGGKDVGWWYQLASGKAIHLPSSIGWIPGLILHFLLLIFFYILISWRGKIIFQEDEE
ncbi:MAG: YeeE/YedE thiosulfate transporter family protein [Halanaerobiales bacterium]